MNAFAKVGVGIATFLVASYLGNKVINEKRNKETVELAKKLIDS